MNTGTMALQITVCFSTIGTLWKSPFKQLSCTRCFKNRKAIRKPSSVPIVSLGGTKISEHMVLLNNTNVQSVVIAWIPFIFLLVRASEETRGTLPFSRTSGCL